MIVIKLLCAKIRKTFFEAIDENPLSAALMIGNLYLCLERANENDKMLLQETEQHVKQKLSALHIQLLWKTLAAISPRQLRLMTRSNQKPLSILKAMMLSDELYYQQIDNKDLIKAGQHPQRYREVLIALIRKFLTKNNSTDPFADGAFDYELLRSSGSEQNHLYLGQFIKDCDSLPVDDLVSLGSENSFIASLMLMDLKDHPLIFQISSRFANIHPSLRQEISDNWRAYFETFPLTSKQEKYVHDELTQLQKKFPEFSNVSINRRVRRDYQVEKKDDSYEIYKKTMIRCFNVGFIIALPANSLTIPIFAGFGIYSLYSIVSERNKNSQNHDVFLDPVGIRETLTM